MKARKRKNVRARLSKRYARIVKDARGRHDIRSWASSFYTPWTPMSVAAGDLVWIDSFVVNLPTKLAFVPDGVGEAWGYGKSPS